jgi:hypothetical protein
VVGDEALIVNRPEGLRWSRTDLQRLDVGCRDPAYRSRAIQSAQHARAAPQVDCDARDASFSQQNSSPRERVQIGLKLREVETIQRLATRQQCLVRDVSYDLIAIFLEKAWGH